MVQDITPEYQKQLSVFNNSNELHAPLMKAFDKINNIFGQQKIRLGSQDRRIWKMKQERLSPRYTTKLSDIITVKV
jgi:DNA polymerase V